MSEYHFAEKPFLAQLEALGWDVIDQGEGIRKGRFRFIKGTGAASEQK